MILDILRALALFVSLALGFSPSVVAGESAAAQAAARESEGALPADAHAFSEQVLQLPGGGVAYQATAAALTLKDDDGRPTSRIFYVAYRQEGEEVRPLTFVFNGGPGAASAYLHLGAIGPRRVVLGDDGSVPPPPVRLADNPQSWLPFTDLVFVDPPGTGFSRSLPQSKEDQQAAGEEDAEQAAPWGIEEDAKVLGDFIRRYLTAEERWSAPVFLAGESYGGFRAALLAERLYADEGIATSGLVLISPVLDFALIRGGDQALLRWSALLPTYAAVASHHGLGPALDLSAADPRAALEAVERYALDDLLAGLSRGLPSEAQQAEGLLQRLADYTGLPMEELRRHRGRVPASRFAKVLLAGKERLVSLYDGSLIQIDDRPATSHAGRDIYLDRLGTTLTAGFHVHLRETLGFQTDLPYRLLNREVSREWNWDSGIRGSQGFASALGDLRRALSLNPAMGVLILHGVHDLVTPYFASAIGLGHMRLDPAIESNARLIVYPGGHMFYARRDSRERLLKDAVDFYREWNGKNRLPHMPAGSH
jgi:carboxypeptidase C (cathepsin A)